MRATIRVLGHNPERLSCINKFKLLNIADLEKGGKVAWQDFESLQAARNFLIHIAVLEYKHNNERMNENFSLNGLTIGTCGARILIREEREKFLASVEKTSTDRYSVYLVNKGYYVYDNEENCIAEDCPDDGGTKEEMESLCEQLNQKANPLIIEVKKQRK